MVVTDKQFKGYVHGWSIPNDRFLDRWAEIMTWCEEYCNCRRGIWWDYSVDNKDFTTTVWFSNKEDLTTFILRWA
jgi:hypothetical protein